ncbi:hypothetical protein D3Z41_11790 [Parabacteroides distasonis]|nr:hypothetical protein [Parabacteroides distasonis]
MTNGLDERIFASWFFHNSIRFKVNKVWLGLVVRQALIVIGGGPYPLPASKVKEEPKKRPSLCLEVAAFLLENKH